ncbi:AbrB family transcriptional regulator [Nguyenibacter vanlangensis]|uniref:AbrB family transcriptional regulator n=1 Tax=Nguyenibacter vanlangensis TaxID=1216886 RepID=A0ABZ3D870_9PROT
MLGALTVAVVCLLMMLHLPAALLMGAIGAGILQALLEGSVRVAPLPFALAQGIVGCMIGRGLRPSILHEVARNWPLFLGGVLFAIVAGIVLGWMLMRLRVLPGTTALWGISPGAATAMVLMADAFGADSRLVAFMQYMRVLCVALTASIVARWWGVDMGHRPPVIWFPPLPVPQFAATLGLIGGGVVLARRLAVPAGALLLPLVLGVAAQDGGGLAIILPPWLLAVAYVLVGWSIGLRFTRPILRHAARAAPRVLAAIAALIVLCGGMGWVLARLAGIDPLTAYLATSPGGADSVAIIAASSPVDLAFVMAMQLVRFVVVVAVTPALTRFLARRAAA